ncbi:hypothetical protein HALDL1_11330 [Halobacterium sp. DL1]|jgi:hypothetical protein|nr:hypothetical protein HALDL1_11330 [Halobacterium sp. DL1]
MTVESLVEYLQDRAGGHLRGVVRYDGSGFDVVYVRDGLDGDAFRARVSNIHESIVGQPAAEIGDETFGKAYATLSVRKHAVVLNFRREPRSGILVGLDPEAARQLVAFIHESMERGLPEGSPA